MKRQLALLLLVLVVPSFGFGGEAGVAESAWPIVIAHRGASGYRPEHTVAGYKLAIEQGADYIEPDLVLTKDGALVIRHDHYLSTTTDVADHPEFADRRKKLGNREDWFTEDFTLGELKTLRTRQPFRGRSIEFDGQFEIPTFQEAIDLVRAESRESGRVIGIYPETKDPAYFASLGFDFAHILLAALKKNPDIPEGVPIYIQSFEPEILEQLNKLTDLPLIQLVTPAVEPSGRILFGQPNIALARIATFADGVGAEKSLLVDDRGRPTSFVADAHARHLLVHVWTFRIDAYPQNLYANGEEEIMFYLQLGMDGFFTDFPDIGVKVRDEFIADSVE